MQYFLSTKLYKAGWKQFFFNICSLQQDTDGIQNMSGVYLIGLIFIK